MTRPACISLFVAVALGGSLTAFSPLPGASEIPKAGSDKQNPQPLIRLTRNAGNNGNPAWSPDGTCIVFESDRDGNYEIYLVNADGSGPVRLTHHPDGDYGPLWSPDGSKILFGRFSEGQSAMYSMNADGSDQRRLGRGFRPVLSPQGSRIAFDAYMNEIKSHQVFVMDAGGSHVTRLTHTAAYESAPRWSPDGSKLVFFSMRDFYPYENLRQAPSEIYVMSADGSTQTRLTVLNGNSKYPRWSPDGSRIGFESDASGNEEIYIMNADGSELTNITNHPAQERNVAWSPDGSKIIFSSDRDGNFDLYVHELTPSVP